MSKLLEKLNEIAEEFECEVISGDDFCCNLISCEIYVNENDTDTRFFEFAKSQGLDERVGNFVISFFHELGHIETVDYVDDYNIDKNLLSFDDYFWCEDEIEATRWAIKFCNSHIDLVEEIQKLL